MRRQDWVAFAVAFLVMCGIAVPATSKAQDAKRVTRCANNLSQLYKMMFNYMAQYGGADKLMPTETGDGFWLKLSKMTPPMIDSTLGDIYQCPVERADDEGCDYRGPKSNINDGSTADSDVVGADVDGNHGEGKGGNVVLKAGDVRTVTAGDPAWISAAKTTSGGNKAIPPKPRVETAKQKRALVDIAHLAIDIMLYREFVGTMPGSLKDLVEKPKEAKGWPDGGFVSGGKLPKDPWGNDYVYVPSDREPKVVCLGADGKRGGSGEDEDLSFQDVFTGRPEAAKAATNEAAVTAALKTICTAQADFRSNDRDNNGVNDFWVGDLRSLYWLNASKDGSTPCKAPTADAAIKLVSDELANADIGRLTLGDVVEAKFPASPFSGYFFRAVAKNQEGKPYTSSDKPMEANRNATRYAFCAIPAPYGKSGTWTYLVNEDCTIWRKDTGGNEVEQMPKAPGREGWTKLD